MCHFQDWCTKPAGEVEATLEKVRHELPIGSLHQFRGWPLVKTLRRHDSNFLASSSGQPNHHIGKHIYISVTCLIQGQLRPLVTPTGYAIFSEDTGEDKVEFLVCKIDPWTFSVSVPLKELQILAYPKHPLVPFEKVSKYLSSLGFSSQRSGLKVVGSGNISRCLWNSRPLIVMGVPLGITQSLVGVWNCKSSVGAILVIRVALGWMRSPSWMIAVRYGSCST